MKRNAGARDSGGKPESRFAALTSGLLARKGSAIPSNSPIADPAEETDAFALEPTYIAARKKAAPDPAPVVAPAPAVKSPPKEADRKTPPAPQPAPKPAPMIATKSAPAPPVVKNAASTMTVINERSEEAGYPDNPSPEDIAALEAEADEVVSYFENFGKEPPAAPARERMDAADRNHPDEVDVEDTGDGDDAPPVASGPWAGGSVPAVAELAAAPVRAGVTVQLTAREFMRLSLGAADLDLSSQDLIAEAIEEYLDARGVLSLGGCSCLDALAKPPGG